MFNNVLLEKYKCEALETNNANTVYRRFWCRHKQAVRQKSIETVSIFFYEINAK